MAVADAMFSSASCNWGTPDDFYASINAEYGPFTLDVAAGNASESKCAKFYSPEDDGLKQSWKDDKCFANPPWTDENPVTPWIKKAIGNDATLIVPSRTDTHWFADIFEHAAVIAFVKGRLVYKRLETPDEKVARYAAWWAKKERLTVENPKKAKAMGKRPVDQTSAPFPSAVAVFRPGTHRQIVRLIDRHGKWLS